MNYLMTMIHYEVGNMQGIFTTDNADGTLGNSYA